MDKAEAQAAEIEKLDVGEGHVARARIATTKKEYDVADREYRAAIQAKPSSKSYKNDYDEFLRRHGKQVIKHLP